MAITLWIRGGGQCAAGMGAVAEKIGHDTGGGDIRQIRWWYRGGGGAMDKLALPFALHPLPGR